MFRSARKDFNLSGFTLIELLVVISILAILSVIGFTVFSNVQKSARDAKRRADIDAIAKAMEIYYSTNRTYSLFSSPATACTSNWACNMNEPTCGANGTQTGCPSSIGNAMAGYFAGDIPRDPLCPSLTNCTGYDYTVVVPWGGESFTVYAKLETAPNNPCPDNFQTSNYCLKNQQ